MKCDTWSESDIGSGAIVELVTEALSSASANLVDYHQKIHFKNKCANDVLRAEKILYHLYRNDDIIGSIKQVSDFFGGRYDLITYLFFVKDETTFLPVRSDVFDICFGLIGCSSNLSGNFSAAGYNAFINAIKAIQTKLSKKYADVSLLDAHSFVWWLATMKRHFDSRDAADILRFDPSLKIGDVITNEQISSIFKVGNMGDMRRSISTNTLVIISDHTKSLYDDRWEGDVLHYTGMGKIGDQKLDSTQNKTLNESNSNGVDVHLLEVLEEHQYTYMGRVKLAGIPYQAVQKDDVGNNRKVWMFPIKVADDSFIIDEETYERHIEADKKKAASTSDEDLMKRAEEASKHTASLRTVATKVYDRDQNIAELAKRRATGICQLCEHPAPFKDKNGKPYLESHHIVWLSKGGEDSKENTVALCPNCHRKMHIVNDMNDIEKLKKKTTSSIINSKSFKNDN